MQLQIRPLVRHGLDGEAPGFPSGLPRPRHPLSRPGGRRPAGLPALVTGIFWRAPHEKAGKRAKFPCKNPVYNNGKFCYNKEQKRNMFSRENPFYRVFHAKKRGYLIFWRSLNYVKRRMHHRPVRRPHFCHQRQRLRRDPYRSGQRGHHQGLRRGARHQGRAQRPAH